MRKYMVLAAAAVLSVAGAANAATFDYIIGDIDNFGGANSGDNRSGAEFSATDGAQFTDRLSTGVGESLETVNLSFNIDNFASISSMTLGVFSLGLQSNDTTVGNNVFVEDGVTFEGSLLTEFFNGVDQGPSGSGLTTGSISSSLFSKALDGQADFSILMNSRSGTGSPTGEPVAFDYFTLSIDGKLSGATPIPLPASLPLLVIALGSIAALRKRKAS